MYEDILETIEEQLRYDLQYFKKYGIKSAMVQRALNKLGLDDDDLKQVYIPNANQNEKGKK